MGNKAQPKSKTTTTIITSSGISSSNKKSTGSINKSTVRNLEEHIEQASKTGVFTFRDHNLATVPTQVFTKLTGVRTIDISNNRLVALPTDISLLTKLKSLTATNNRIEQISDEIGSVQKLEALRLSHNALADIPATLLSLKSLKVIDLSHNLLTQVPSVLVFLPKLATLDLSHNHIDGIIREISHLSCDELNLDNNKIQRVPAELAACPNLKVLRIENNLIKLTDIAREILTESRISLIKISGNLFAETDFYSLPGHEVYEERYAAVKNKCL